MINLPNTLQHLTLKTGHFTQSCDELPKSLQLIKIHFTGHSQKLQSNLSFEKFSQLHTLKLSWTRSIKTTSDFPNSLRKLTIKNNEFNNPLNFLPNELKCLTIKSSIFNQPLNDLPPLHTLKIQSDIFNQPIDNLPNTLHTLKIKNFIFDDKKERSRIHKLDKSDNRDINDEGFNQSISNLPPNLHTLVIASDIFNHHLDNLPQSLNELFFSGYDFDLSLDKLPSNLNFLLIDDNHIHYSLDNLPKNLHSLIIKANTITTPINNLPENLYSLKINLTSGSPTITKFPEFLHALIFDVYGKNEFDVPKSLGIFGIRMDYLKTIDFPCPHIHTFIMNCKAIKKIKNFPSSCKSLYLHNYNDTYNIHIPMDNITHLKLINCKIDESFINNLPYSLQSLKLKDTLTPKIELENFPHIHKLKINGIIITK